MTAEDFHLKHGLFDDLRQDYPVVGRKDEMRRLDDFIDKKFVGSRTFLIIGDYGIGKTLLLKKSEKDLAIKKSKITKKSCYYYAFGGG